MLIFLSFSVGLDPRQREVFGPALGPVFVGIIPSMVNALPTDTTEVSMTHPGMTNYNV
jgi:hypothetical protein